MLDWVKMLDWFFRGDPNFPGHSQITLAAVVGFFCDELLFFVFNKAVKIFHIVDALQRVFPQHASHMKQTVRIWTRRISDLIFICLVIILLICYWKAKKSGR